MFFKRFAVLIALCSFPAGLMAEEELTFTPSMAYFVWQSISTEKTGTTTVSKSETRHFGFPGFSVKKQVGSNEIEGVFMTQSFDGSLDLYQMYAALTRNEITYKLGFFDPSDVSLGFSYLPLKSDPEYFGVMIAQGSYLGVDLNDLGLSVIYGSQTIQHQADNGDATADAGTDQQTSGAYFNNEFGSLSVAAAVVQVAHKNDKNKNPSAAALAAGDYTDLMTNFGVSFDTDFVSFTAQGQQTKNTTVALVTTENRSNLNLDFPTAEGDGFGLSVTQQSTKDDTPNPAMWSISELGYTWGVDALQLSTMLFSSLTHDADVTDDTTEQGLIFGMVLDF